MNEQLVIRLPEWAEQPYYWLIWSNENSEVIASGVGDGVESLHLLEDKAKDRVVIALVPSCTVIFKHVTLPGRYTPQALKALPYLLEEECASDVDQLHLAVLSRTGSELEVAAVTRARMDEWLEWLDDAGLEADRIIPDVLALPEPLENQWLGLQLGSQWLFRTGTCKGLCAEDSWLEPLFAGDESSPEVKCLTPVPKRYANVWHEELAELAMQPLAKGVANSRFNLLQGSYRRQPEYTKLLRIWMKPGIALVALFIVMLLNRGLTLYRLSDQQQQVNTQITQLYHQLFPNEKRIVNVRAQLNAHLRRFTQASSQQGLLPMLTDLRSTFLATPKLQLLGLNYEGRTGRLRLEVSADGLPTYEKFRSMLNKRYTSQLGEVHQKDGMMNGAITINDGGRG